MAECLESQDQPATPSLGCLLSLVNFSPMTTQVPCHSYFPDLQSLAALATAVTSCPALNSDTRLATFTSMDDMLTGLPLLDAALSKHRFGLALEIARHKPWAVGQPARPVEGGCHTAAAAGMQQQEQSEQQNRTLHADRKSDNWPAMDCETAHNTHLPLCSAGRPC